MSREQAANGLFACPCCGYATLEEPSSYEICDICFWEDDGQDDPDADGFIGGPNHLPLTEARVNFLTIGACDPKDKAHVRSPTDRDINVRFYSKNKLYHS